MYRPARENPSFSSSLLDEIYRSIDERTDHESIGYRETTREKQGSFFTNNFFQHDRDVDVKRQNYSGHGREVRDCLIENWMGKEVRSVVDFKRSSHRSGNSSSSSSDSSSGGGFSSSETESVYCVSSRPKPIRTSSNRHHEYTTSAKQMSMYQHQRYQFEQHDSQSKQKHESKLVKTKSRAMKIYGDLKKAKQPISPGGKLATFLNSIFTATNTKNTNNSSSSTGCYDDSTQSKSASGSTCSSASSFSRSCLSKTPSSRGKQSGNKKRSVRFYPVSVIVGDDSQPCGHKSLYGDESNIHAIKAPNEEPRVYTNEKTRRIEEAARNLLRNYQKKVECEYDLITKTVKVENETHLNYEDDEDDDDDVGSNASSDLFELENFSAIGMENYGDELPVYETTVLDTSLAVGNGFRM